MFITVEDQKIPEVNKIIQRLSDMTSSEISFDEKTKTYNVIPKGNPYDAMKATNVIKAIGLGFNVTDALKLLSDEYELETIDLKETMGKDQDDMRRVKARVIGEKGKTKKFIEEYTGVIMSIHENHISFIGPFDQVAVARKAVELIILGREHQSVYKYLDRAEKELMQYKMEKLKRSSNKFYEI
ncbi:KH domain-containing protein [Sulfuracidifex tepidarius]